LPQPGTVASFDLIASGAALHWVDPEVRYRKSAQLLRPGGWLAVLDIDERYDDPLGAALTEMWVARGDGSGAWTKRASDAELITSTGWFSEPIHRTFALHIVRPADVVIGVENTRATSLSWPAEVRRGFTEELAHHLESRGDVHLTQQTSVTMARTPRCPD
jgi:SAM-dependent methyltransferase